MITHKRPHSTETNRGKFLAKLAQWQETPEDYWTEYHLLGYWIDRTGMQLNLIDGEKPKNHPQVRLMRKIIAQLENPHLRWLPSEYNSGKVKQFLDWCLAALADQGTDITSLGYIAKQSHWFQVYAMYPHIMDRRIIQKIFERYVQNKPKQKITEKDLLDYIDKIQRQFEDIESKTEWIIDRKTHL